MVNGREIFYFGRIPSSRCIFIASAYRSRIVSKSLYVSAFEAVMNGYDVLFMPFSENADAIESGVMDAGGHLNYILPSGFSRTGRIILHKAMVTAGSAITAEEDGTIACRESANRARSLGSALSDCVIVADDRIRRNGIGYIDEALDMGKDIAILKDALASGILREYAKAGAPVIGSFSDLLSLPRCILYPESDGRYGFRGDKFDMIKLADD